MLKLPSNYVRDRKVRGLLINNSLLETYDDNTFVFSVIPLGRIAIITAPVNDLLDRVTGEAGYMPLKKIGIRSSDAGATYYPVEILQTKYLNILTYDLSPQKPNLTLTYKLIFGSRRVKNTTQLPVSGPGPGPGPAPGPAPAPGPTPPYAFTVTTLMKDETQFLEEWLNYYSDLGVQHFYLYDNGTSDQVALHEVLDPWCEKGVVTFIPWNFPYGPTDGEFSAWVGGDLSGSKVKVSNHRYCQPAQTNDALLRFGPSSKWMLFIDVDEYLNTRGRSLSQVVFSVPRSTGVLSYASIWFGNPRKEPIKVPQGELVRNWYQYRSDKSCGRNRRKCLVNPKRVRKAGALWHIHGPTMPRTTTTTTTWTGTKTSIKSLVQYVPEAKGIFHHYYCCSSKSRTSGHNEVFDDSLKYSPPS